MSSGTQPIPYAYDRAHAALVAPLMDAAALACEAPFEVPSKVRAAAASSGVVLPDELFHELWNAMDYTLTELDSRQSMLLAPVSSKDASWPRPMDEATPDVRQLWTDLTGQVTAPMLVAHFADILLSARIVTGLAPAERTIDAYLAVSTTPTAETLFVTEGLMRAATIARVYKLTTHEARVRERMFNLANASLSASTPMAGLVLRLLQTLSQVPATASFTAPTRVELEALLDRAHQTFADEFSVDAIAAASLTLATTDAERSAARRRQVTSYIAIADSSTGPVRMLRLNQAAQLADRHGLIALRDEAVRKMQAMKPADMQWHVVETEVTIPRREIERWLRQFQQASNWGEALRIWLTTDAPTGRYTDNLAATKKALGEHGLLTIFPTTLFGQHGMPQRSFGSLEENEQRHLVDLEANMARLFGRLHAEALNRIRDRFGQPATNDVAAFLVETYGSDVELAEVIASALSLFWDGLYFAATHLVYPAIESGARAVLLALDEPMYRVEAGKSPGRFPALDFYLDALETHGFDPDWDRAIRSLLLSEGNNLRNLTAHGFRHFFSASEAASLTRIAAMFATIAPPDASAADRKTVAAFVRKPNKVTRRKLKPRLGVVWR